MRDIPIIFSAPMIRALLREVEAPGTGKTMTRRLAWRKEERVIEVTSEHLEDYELRNIDCQQLGPSEWRIRYPSLWQKVKPGDRLWVRENIGRRPAATLFGTRATNGVEEAFYSADDESVLNEHGFNLCPWWESAGTLPCIHMPRWASRLALVVTAAKIERLQEISEEDAIAEGICALSAGSPVLKKPFGIEASQDKTMLFVGDTARGTFKLLWDGIHGDGAWSKNSEVVAVSFRVVKQNIDQMKEAA